MAFYQSSVKTYLWPVFALIILVDVIIRRTYFLSVEPSKIGIYLLSILFEGSLFLGLVQLLSTPTGTPRTFSIKFVFFFISTVYTTLLFSSWGFYLYFSRLPGIFGFSYFLEGPEEAFKLASHSFTPLAICGLLTATFFLYFCFKSSYACMRQRSRNIVLLIFFGLIPVLNHNLLISTGASLPVTDAIFGLGNAINSHVQGKVFFRLQPRLVQENFEPLQQKSLFNGILIVNESLRKSNFKIYGYKRETSPNLDRFLSREERHVFLFENAFSSSIMTYIAMPSILSGRSALEGLHALEKSSLVFEEVKRLQNMKTALIASHAYLPGNFKAYIESKWLDFLWYREIENLPAYNNIGVDDKYVAERFEHFLSSLKGEDSFFAILHLNGTHYPYNSPQEFKKFSDSSELVDIYDNAIAYLDFNLGTIFKVLENSGRLDNTWVWFTSDHAESLGEDGINGHVGAFNIWNSNIPFFLAIPDKIATQLGSEKMATLRKNRNAIVGNLDLVPSILDLYGIPFPRNSYKGISLFNPIEKDRVLEIYHPPAADLEEQLGIPRRRVNGRIEIEIIK